ncbi:MAG: toxin-antitoxin system YwqK family antitoxin [Bacteroidota bacterium]
MFKSDRLIIIQIVLLLIGNSIFAQTYLTWYDVEKQQFGREIIFKDNANNVLEGHYKISDERGNYFDLNFKNGKKHGQSKEYDYNDRVLKIMNYEDGIANGTFTTYHQNGKIQKQGYFLKGEEEGKWETFDDKGELMTLENYKNGLKEGKWMKKLHYSSQNISGVRTEYYKNNEPTGHWKEKYEDGTLIWERDHTANDSYIQKDYFPNGKLRFHKQLKDGKLDGDKLEYNQDGVLLRKMKFIEDQLQISELFHKNAAKKEVQHYDYGKKNGLYELYHENGTKILSGNYADGYKDGVWKNYNAKNGIISEKTTFKNNVKNGLYLKYNKAERLSREGNYLNDVKHGTWKFYNLAGKLNKEIVYDRGKITSSKEFVK